MSLSESNKKIAIIGDKDSVLGFRAVGFDVRFCETAEEAETELRKLCRTDDYGIVYITDVLFSRLDETVNKYKDRVTPAIIPIPSKLGSNGVGVARVKKSVEKAVGADILFK